MVYSYNTTKSNNAAQNKFTLDIYNGAIDLNPELRQGASAGDAPQRFRRRLAIALPQASRQSASAAFFSVSFNTVHNHVSFCCRSDTVASL